MASPRVIAIQFDGLRADALSEQSTPNLLAAAERGAWFRNHHSTFPTSTRVCVSSLATGVYPEKHGLPGNSLFSRELGETITTGRHENLLAWERAMGGCLLLRDTFFERVGGGAIISAASSGSAWLWNAGRAARLIHPVAAYPAEERETIEEVREIPAGGEPDLDRCAWVLDLALDYVIPKLEPAVLVIHLSEPDSTQHQEGAAGAVHRQALEGVDRLFGAFWQKFQSERDDWSQTNLLLFSDHGVVATAGMIDLEAELADLPGRGDSWQVAHSEGAALFYAESEKTLLELVAFLQTKDWAGPLFSKDGEGIEGALPGTMSLGLAGCGGARAPDLLMGFQWGDGFLRGENREGALPGWGYSSVNNKGSGGTHGSCSPYELRNFLIGAGPAFPAGARVNAPTGNIDLAPTILSLMGKETCGLDGEALTSVSRGRGEERVYRVDSKGFAQTLSRAEVDGRFYLNFARLEKA
ncbi:MAG: alkaline phosphatase family protein [Nitrospinae bacterium]|nr:alkaline phosphatase family protein [Nitrospinota bacterium]